MVDYIPFLKYVPAWVPGASSKKLGKLYKPGAEDMRDLPYDAAKNDVVSCAFVPSCLDLKSISVACGYSGIVRRAESHLQVGKDLRRYQHVSPERESSERCSWHRLCWYVVSIVFICRLGLLQSCPTLLSRSGYGEPSAFPSVII